MQADREASLKSFRSLWQRALSRPLHNNSCGCSVPMAGFLKADDLELDLLDYVEDKHSLQNIEGWRDARVAREASKTCGYADWLETLRASVLAEELHDAVLSDMRATLESITAHSTGKIVPAGSLQSGWLGDGLRSPD